MGAANTLGLRTVSPFKLAGFSYFGLKSPDKDWRQMHNVFVGQSAQQFFSLEEANILLSSSNRLADPDRLLIRKV